jgi:hypothetical protein
LLGQLAGEEVSAARRALRSLAFQREMPGVEQMDFGIRVVSFEGLGAGRQEERIVLAPYREKLGPPGADVLLEFGIERDIALVVAEQIKLDLVIAGSGEERRVDGPGIR